VLVDARGPVIIDLPQAVNAAGNNSAAMLFARDIDNLARFFGRFEPAILGLGYAKEIWALYEKGKLTPHVELTGTYVPPAKRVDVGGVLRVIEDVQKERDFKVGKQAEKKAERRAEKVGRGSVPPTDGMLHRIDEPSESGRGSGRESGRGPGPRQHTSKPSQNQQPHQTSRPQQSPHVSHVPKAPQGEQWGRRGGRR
jgi:serine/threonine-protein kinase RIO1